MISYVCTPVLNFNFVIQSFFSLPHLNINAVCIVYKSDVEYTSYDVISRYTNCTRDCTTYITTLVLEFLCNNRL